MRSHQKQKAHWISDDRKPFERTYLGIALYCSRYPRGSHKSTIQSIDQLLEPIGQLNPQQNLQTFDWNILPFWGDPCYGGTSGHFFGPEIAVFIVLSLWRTLAVSLNVYTQIQNIYTKYCIFFVVMLYWAYCLAIFLLRIVRKYL